MQRHLQYCIVFFLLMLVGISQSMEQADDAMYEDAEAEDSHAEQASEVESDEHMAEDTDEQHMDEPDAEENVGDEDTEEQTSEETGVNSNEFVPEESKVDLLSEHVSEIHRKMDADKNGNVSMDEVLDFAHKMLDAKVKTFSVANMLPGYDQNEDGKLSWEEIGMHGVDEADQGAKDLAMAKFKAADFNSDGFLNAAELHAKMYPHTNVEMITRLTANIMKIKDSDGNGRLSEKEFSEHFRAHQEFFDLDKDSSGDLDEKEYRAYEDMRFETEQEFKHLFSIADHNHDGMLTAEELDSEYDAIVTALEGGSLTSLQDWAQKFNTLSREQLHSIHHLMDSDHTGNVSLSEILSFAHKVLKAELKAQDMKGLFEDTDVNKDGKLSWVEVANHWHGGESSQEDDGNNDYLKLSRERELAKFKGSDQNGDGLLDIEEFKMLMYAEQHVEMMPTLVADFFNRTDLDHDGKLEEYEFAPGEDSGLGGDFALLDKDHNGFLDKQEIEAYLSPHYITQQHMEYLIATADVDNNSMLSVGELQDAQDSILSHQSLHEELLRWAKFHSEL